MPTLSVVSDVVCPWCYIGKHRLNQALANIALEAPDFDINIRWLPFELNPDLPAESPYNFIMMYLCSTDDEGLSVLPTHRLLDYPSAMSADQVVDILKKGFEVEEINGGSREILVAEILSRMNESTMTSSVPVFGMYHAGEDRSFFLQQNPRN